MDLNEFINDNHKDKNRFCQNYFFAGTVLLIITNIIIYTSCGYLSKFIKYDYNWHWKDVLYFNRLAYSFLNSFGHLTLQHVLLNMLCFLACGIYLERKTGSMKFIMLVLAMAFFTSSAISANNLSLNWLGFSGVIYGLYFYIITDFLFTFKSKQKRHNIIIGCVILFLIYVACCFSGGVAGFSFKAYPYDLITNLGHYSSAITGLIMGLMIQITHLKTGKIK